MALKDEIETRIDAILRTDGRTKWETRDGRSVPSPEDVAHGNVAVHLKDATVLYADMTQSTKLVETKKWWFSAEVYKSYLYAASRIIRHFGGTITSYDGDRVMGIFIGDEQHTNAAIASLKINSARIHIINPRIEKRYSGANYAVGHKIGIDTSTIWAARTGVRGDSDLVWIGPAANHAAKLTDKNGEPVVWITKSVFDRLQEKARMGGNPRRAMWKQSTWSEYDGRAIYGSTWYWPL